MHFNSVLRTIGLLSRLGLSAGCSSERPVFSSAGPEGSPLIAGELYRPTDSGVFPAVIVLHGCSGVLDGVERAWGRRLAEWGYVAFLPDSFGPRGFREVCSNGRVSPWTDRSFDAYGALHHIQTLPYVDPQRVAVMGFSHGGITTLIAMNANFVAGAFVSGAAPSPGFKAAIAFYPSCGARLGEWLPRRAGPGFTGAYLGAAGVYRSIAPLLILSGADDDWTPAAPCQHLAAVSREAGYPVDTVVYAGAAHSFDNENTIGRRTLLPQVLNVNRPGGCCGATVGGNAEALAASIKAVEAFLAQNLQK